MAGPQQRSGLRAHFDRAPITVALIALAVVVYFITAALSGSFAENLSSAEVAGFSIYGPGMCAGWFAPLRLFTGPLLHIGPGHLLSNIMLLGLAAPQVERFWGSLRYSLMLVVCAAASSVAVLWWTPLSPTVGLSGAVLGMWMVLGAQFALVDRQLLRPIAVLVVVTLLMPVVVPNVSWSGHLGGLLAGSAVGAGWAAVLTGRFGAGGSGAAGRRFRLYAVLAVVAGAVAIAAVAWWLVGPICGTY
ncbi:rhomboid family intramembrane serine protease [Corynebacterium sp. TAE3-ERU12]|uniref:rhomboid family intramembrane serine protease n=1 Tax=Corynebacterium sp. TAE3-ERU12 TaxID=2849491 RepID=UPI001C45314D|nr:rhomboid family intramembrane serine protease [Corynebacterium sp. TAE3-ERU12]MBV7294359.1 rhomboid family intramembrane serine protease [Corynebacterium sp. TAE3-ERU12]